MKFDFGTKDGGPFLILHFKVRPLKMYVRITDQNYLPRLKLNQHLKVRQEFYSGTMYKGAYL